MGAAVFAAGLIWSGHVWKGWRQGLRDRTGLVQVVFNPQTEPAAHAGFRRILVTEPGHPYLEAWWPPGHGLGYEHTFVHQARDLLHAIASGTAPAPSFADGLSVQRVLAAVEESAEKNAVYTPVSGPTPTPAPVDASVNLA